jgi:hypothetical protein
MSYSSLEGERLFFTDPTDPRIRRDATELRRVIAELTEPELLALIVFCALGLAATLALCSFAPSLAEGVASFQNYP